MQSGYLIVVLVHFLIVLHICEWVLKNMSVLVGLLNVHVVLTCYFECWSATCVLQLTGKSETIKLGNVDFAMDSFGNKIHNQIWALLVSWGWFLAIFGKSCDLKTKTPKTQAVSIFPWWNKCERIECIQMQKLTYGFVEIHVIEKAMMSHKLYDIITF